jgi:hypothetical protein
MYEMYFRWYLIFGPECGKLKVKICVSPAITSGDLSPPFF